MTEYQKENQEKQSIIKDFLQTMLTELKKNQIEVERLKNLQDQWKNRAASAENNQQQELLSQVLEEQNQTAQKLNQMQQEEQEILDEIQKSQNELKQLVQESVKSVDAQQLLEQLEKWNGFPSGLSTIEREQEAQKALEELKRTLSNE